MSRISAHLPSRASETGPLALCTVTVLRILQDPRKPATPLPVELFSAITTEFQMAGIAGFASKKMAPQGAKRIATQCNGNL